MIAAKCGKCGVSYNAMDGHECKTVKRLVKEVDRQLKKAVSEDVREVSDICPTCGHRRSPMTNAERQRNYRKRQKGKT